MCPVEYDNMITSQNNGESKSVAFTFQIGQGKKLLGGFGETKEAWAI